MSTYCAFIGHQPHLSLAELSTRIVGFRPQKILRSEVVIFASDEHINMATLGSLGGTICIARELPGVAMEPEKIAHALSRETGTVKGKITFSLRAHGVQPGEISRCYRACKEWLRKHGRPSRYVGSERNPALSIVLHAEGLIDGTHGCEIVLIRAKDFAWVGRTVAAQDIEAYTKRDMRKPVRNTTAGLLPPKLAQILLNFGAWAAQQAGTMPANGTLAVWDPFCGTGVIPMETLLRGWTALASDLSLPAVNGCRKNIEWLRKEAGIAQKDAESLVWKQDARKPFDPPQGRPYGQKVIPGIIVTEGHLGPALSGKPSLKDTQKMRTAIEHLQEEFLRATAEHLPTVPVVIIWPVWYTRKEQHRLERVWDTVHELGYSATIPPGIASDHPKWPSLLYRRPDQHVAREIVILLPRKKR